MAGSAARRIGLVLSQFIFLIYCQIQCLAHYPAHFSGTGDLFNPGLVSATLKACFHKYIHDG